MKTIHSLLLLFAIALALAEPLTLLPQSAMNQGLVGVGRLSANAFDQLGPNVDSLGGIGSSVYIDPTSLVRSGDESNGFVYAGTYYCVADRGFGSGTQDYHPRLQKMSFSIAPYYGSEPTTQTQISFQNTATTVFTYEGSPFTGFEPSDPLATVWPTSPTNSLGQGRRSLDPEGLVRAKEGGWFISDEYGPSILHFDQAGVLQSRIVLPEAVIPKRGSFPGVNAYGATNSLLSGRRANRGIEGLTLTPDGKRLVGAFQDPLQQDGNGSALARNTRLLLFDVESGSPSEGRLVAEYLYRVTLNNSLTTNKQTSISEIYAVNRETFMVLERDSFGLGDTTPTSPIYKSVVLVNTHDATNIANTGYDLERGAPQALSLPIDALPSNIAPVSRQDFVSIINSNELSRFGLNLHTNKDLNTLCEKWEGMGLVPLGEANAPDDYLLLLFNDNDFTAPTVYHNGVVVGTNATTIDNMILAYRVTLPGVDAASPANILPGVILTGPTNAMLSAPASFTLTAQAYDPDGIILNVEFFEDGKKIGEDSTFPFQVSITGAAFANHSYTAVVKDNSGGLATSDTLVVVVSEVNLPPAVALVGPTNATLSAPASVSLTATAGDIDGVVVGVEFFDGDTSLGKKVSVPYTLTATNVTPGIHTYTAVATDNQGVRTTSDPFAILITDVNLPPVVSLLTPTNGFDANQPINLAFTADASDPDGTIAKVEYYLGSTLLGSSKTAPYLFTASNFIAGVSAVTARAYDNHGLTTNSDPRSVQIHDGIAPILRCSTNRIVACTDPAGTPVSFVVTATDNNDSSVAVVCNPPSGSLFPAGTNVVTCTATDAAGNRNTCEFRVIVLPSALTIERAVLIRWNCGEALQSADDPAGPWTDVEGVQSPYCVPESLARKFYRVRN